MILTSPESILLSPPAPEPAPSARTRALVAERWPRIERLCDEGDRAAVDALTDLAAGMRAATATDPPMWREPLTQARLLVYDALAEVARAWDSEPARAALRRALGDDPEAAPHVEELLAR